MQHLSNGVNPNELHRSPPKFLRKLYQQQHCWLVLKRVETEQNEEPLGLQNSEITQLQTSATFPTKWKGTSESGITAQRAELRAMENDSQALKTNRGTSSIPLLNFKIATSSDSFVCPIRHPLSLRRSLAIALCLRDCCILSGWVADNYLCFTDLQNEKNCTQRSCI